MNDNAHLIQLALPQTPACIAARAMIMAARKEKDDLDDFLNRLSGEPDYETRYDRAWAAVSLPADDPACHSFADAYLFDANMLRCGEDDDREDALAWQGVWDSAVRQARLDIQDAHEAGYAALRTALSALVGIAVTADILPTPPCYTDEQLAVSQAEAELRAWHDAQPPHPAFANYELPPAELASQA